MSWWDRNIGEPGKLPLLLCFAAFIVTFLGTRTITRLIRAGRGPFKNNVSESGVHIHHAVPGIILLVAASLLAVSPADGTPWREVAAAAIGVGASLVLDEFALILHLDDVYWAQEGRVSVEMVSLATAFMGLVLIGGAPFGVNGIEAGELGVRLGAIVGMVVNVGLVLVNVFKGKVRLALLAAFVPLVSWIGAIRLARPGSRWARRYDAATLQRATERVARFDARWDPITTKLSNLVAGAVSTEADTRPGS